MSAVPMCPDCGLLMVEREGRRGSYWGCQTYPVCKGVRNGRAMVRKARTARSPLNSVTRICTAQVRCDGSTLHPGKQVCGPCGKAIAAKTQAPRRLKGEKLMEHDTYKPKEEK